MNEVNKLLMSTMWLTLGIAPLEKTQLDVNRMLASLPPEEARVMRRKFRKLWRRYAKLDMKTAKRAVQRNAVINSMGLKVDHPDFGSVPQVPTRRQKLNRKRRVANGLQREILNGSTGILSATQPQKGGKNDSR